MKKPERRVEQPADYIKPININGLKGRMLHLPALAANKPDILFVYDRRSTLENWWGFVKALNRYGAVTAADLPGFGGMDSFYKIGKKPTVDNLADYLAAFIKLRFRRKRLVVVGFGFGFVVLTRMLQRSPVLAKKVVLTVSVNGLAHHEDFVFSEQRYWIYRLGSSFLSTYLIAKILHFFSQPALIKAAYRFAAENKEDYKKMVGTGINLWRDNDLRTWMKTNVELLTLDNCQKRVNLPVWHVNFDNRNLNNHIVEQHVQIAFSDFRGLSVNFASKPLTDEKAAAPLLPPRLRRALRSL